MLLGIGVLGYQILYLIGTKHLSSNFFNVASSLSNFQIDTFSNCVIVYLPIEILAKEIL